jgi:phosphatidylserine decarboxylase
MNANFFYTTAAGRGIFSLMQKIGIFRPVAWFLHTKASKPMIGRYIKNNGIDMSPYGNRDFVSFADFFARKRDIEFDDDPNALIAPCDSLLSVYEITSDLEIPMKESIYTVPDLIPESDVAEQLAGGLCLIFRLEASDYHHFCFFDDLRSVKTVYIPGELHSVQPIALRHFPVFRLNRRWWSVMETEHFGTAVQIEIGAMAVGGVTFSEGAKGFKKGAEMGNFELAGSTVALLLNKETRDRLELDPKIRLRKGASFSEEDAEIPEIRVTIGSAIGRLKK